MLVMSPSKRTRNPRKQHGAIFCQGLGYFHLQVSEREKVRVRLRVRVRSGLVRVRVRVMA
jgi:hypothetical protein